MSNIFSLNTPAQKADVFKYREESYYQEKSKLRRSKGSQEPARSSREKLSAEAIKYGGSPCYEDEMPDMAKWPPAEQLNVYRYSLGCYYDTEALTDKYIPQKLSGEIKLRGSKGKDHVYTRYDSSSDSSWSSDDDSDAGSSSWESFSDDEELKESPDEGPIRNWNQELQELMDSFAIAKRKTLAFEETVAQGNNIPPDEETIECYQKQLVLLTKLRQLSHEFREVAEEIAKTIIDEMTLPNRRKTFRPRTEFAGIFLHLVCRLKSHCFSV